MVDVLTTQVARVLFALPFLVLGSMHFVFGPMMVGALPSWVPGGVYMIYFLGACLVAAGISAITTIKAELAMPLLSVVLLAFVVFVHAPGLADKEKMAMAMPGLMKDLGLIGGAFLLWGMVRRQQADKEASSQ